MHYIERPDFQGKNFKDALFAWLKFHPFCAFCEKAVARIEPYLLHKKYKTVQEDQNYHELWRDLFLCCGDCFNNCKNPYDNYNHEDYLWPDDIRIQDDSVFSFHLLPTNISIFEILDFNDKKYIKTQVENNIFVGVNQKLEKSLHEFAYNTIKLFQLNGPHYNYQIPLEKHIENKYVPLEIELNDYYYPKDLRLKYRNEVARLANEVANDFKELEQKFSKNKLNEKKNLELKHAYKLWKLIGGISNWESILKPLGVDLSKPIVDPRTEKKLIFQDKNTKEDEYIMDSESDDENPHVYALRQVKIYFNKKVKQNYKESSYSKDVTNYLELDEY